MPHQVLSSALGGIDAVPVFVQIDSNPGLHSFTIVGLGDKAVQESIDRIEAAIKHSGFVPPRAKNKRFVVNLAPADLKKEGPGYDLPIAIAYLIETKQIALEVSGIIMLGELGLDGALAHTNGILAATLLAQESGASAIIVPFCNAQEAALVEGITILGARTLAEVVAHITGLSSLSPVPSANGVTQGANMLSPSANEVPTGTSLSPQGANLALDGDSLSPLSPVPGANEVPNGTRLAPRPDDSFAYIHGQMAAKRALIVAAAGGHNVLMSGTPGSGKTLLARSITGILPPLSNKETIEVAKIHSAAGLLRGSAHHISRPFCAPHHTASPVSIIGGGTLIRPGQVSLAHRGVLFMDEMPEFARNVLEALRQPLEDGIVTVSRASGSLTLPAKFMLIAAMNPCPCGNAGDPSAICSCTPTSITKYVKKISGPLLDRMDMQLFVSRERLAENPSPDFDALDKIRESIASARAMQTARFVGTTLVTNSEINHRNVRQFCSLEPSAESLLREIINRRNLSLRAYHKVQKVARTIADLEGAPLVQKAHIAEALTLRISDRLGTPA